MDTPEIRPTLIRNGSQCKKKAKIREFGQGSSVFNEFRKRERKPPRPIYVSKCVQLNRIYRYSRTSILWTPSGLRLSVRNTELPVGIQYKDTNIIRD